MKNSLICLFLLGITNSQADLKVEYFDSSKSKGTVTFAPGPDEVIKRWTWTRNGIVILRRIEKERSVPGKFKQTEQIIYQGQSKIFYSLILDGKPSDIFYPAPQIEVARSDTNRDGQIDTISLLDPAHQLVELYSVDDEGLIVPQSDKLLKERRDLLNSIAEKMKGI